MGVQLLFRILILALVFSACSPKDKGSDGGGVLLPKSDDDVNLSCANVFTNEAIQAYNENQNKFRIKGAGFTVHCFSEVTVNGSTSKVEKNGFSGLQILPSLKFISADKQANQDKYILKFEELNVTIDEEKALLRDLDFHIKEGESLPIVENAYGKYPDYVRIGKASLFYLSSKMSRTTESGKEEISFELSASKENTKLLLERMAEFSDEQTQMEILWFPKSNKLYRQTVDKNLNLQSAWSNLETQEILRSLVKEASTAASSETLDSVIDLALYWDCDIKKVHATIPELYFYADSNWGNPSFADNTVDKLIIELKYLLKVNPENNKKDLLSKFDLISKYFPSNKEAIMVAFDVFKGKTYNSAQFDQLVSAAELAFSSFAGNSWKYAELILQNYQFDNLKSSYAITLSTEMVSRGFIRIGSDLNAVANRVYEKIAAGLDSNLKDIYFKVFDLFKSEFSKTLSEKTCDEWVLTHKITDSNLPLATKFMHWAKDTAYVSFDESLKVVDGLIKSNYLTQANIDLYSTSYGWLVNSIYLNRSEAFQLGDEFILIDGMTLEQFTNLKEFTSWFIDSIYMNRREALSKGQSYIFDKKMDTTQTQLFKNIVTWLINSIYLNRSNAVAKAEKFMFVNTKKMDGPSFDQFKDLTEWYINSIYINRSEAIADAERLILVKALSRIQTDLMKKAVEWLINSVYLNRLEAKNKGEVYVADHALDASLLSLVQTEYESLVNKGKTRSEALKTAETKYLGM